MDFRKNLLLVDLEFTGLDVGRHEIIQLAAVLLDKKTLKEEKYFNSYIKPLHWAKRDMESMRVNRIGWDSVKNAPDLKKVIRDFNRFFGHNVVFSYYGGLMDMDFMRAAYRKCNIAWKFDYHYFNLWALFYGFLAARNKLKNKSRFTGFTLNEMMKSYRIKSSNRHDALEDCRIEAEILRKIINKL